MSYEKDIKQKIIEIAQNKGQWLFLAEVESVNGDTCTIKVDNMFLTDVHLTAFASEQNSILITPAVGSMVLVADISGGDMRELYILQYGDIQQITINGGQLGGLPIASKLTDWMNKVAQDMQTLKSLLSATPVAGNGAPLGAVFNPQTTSISIDDLENKAIKHG